MPQPKKRHSKSRQWKRRANWKLTAPTLSVCPQCAAKVLPHNACPACGSYKGREVIKIKEAKEKKEKK
jgi:large subunit ribosomal protein L32